MSKENQALTKEDIKYLTLCLELAQEAFDAGDAPFGSVLVSSEGEVIAEARNRSNEINALAHPEIDLAHWACNNLSEEQRRSTIMYTSGEHCPMCAAAHGWAGLGTIVYLSSAQQLGDWRNASGAPKAPISFMSVQSIVPEISVKGPATGELLEQIKSLQKAYFKKMQ